MFKKNIFFICSIFFLVLLLIGCENEKKKSESNRIVVTGMAQNFKDTTIAFSFYAYEFLKSLERKEVKFAKDGSFKMELDASAPLKGWFSFGKVPVTEKFKYTMVNGQDTIMQTGTNDFRMVYLYLEPGDSVHMQLDVTKIDETLAFTGEAVDNNILVNEEENKFNDYKHKFLRNWYNVSQRKPDDYKNTVNGLYQQKIKFLNAFAQSHVLSENLVNFFKVNYYSDAVASKINYPEINAMYNQGKLPELPSDYFDFLNEVTLDEEIDDFGIGYFYDLKAYLNKKYEVESKQDTTFPEFYDWIGTELPEKVQYQYMAYALGSDFSKRIYDEFGENSPYPEMAKIVKQKYKHLEGMLEGKPAPELILEKTDGTKISLEDLKGKYIYIDLWATWCGPCIKEIPSLKKIEKEYEGRNIHFVSISMDDEKDFDKWKKFVADENLTGIQVIADDKANSIISETFNIKLIPRFILLDPEYRIVDATAPFPSDPELLSLFAELNI